MLRARLLLLLTFVFTSCTASVQSQPTVPDASIDVVHYAFNLTLSDDTDEIEGQASVEVRFLEDDLSAFQLDLVGGDGTEGMHVTSVTQGDAPMTFTHSNDQLRIELGTPVQADAQRTYTITYRGVPADGLIISTNKHGERTFFGDNWPNRARHWLPTVDHPSDKATVEWIVTAPEHYEVVANGRLVEETDLPDQLRLTHWHATAPLPTKVMVIGVADFAVQYVDEYEGVSLQSWVYPQEREDGFYDFARAEPILAFFDSHIGPFPYAKLANVQSKTRYGGMENASAIFYNENAISGTRENEGLLAHEIAHQWFGDSVSETDWPHLWLSEGFATYLTQLYMEFTYGRDRMDAGMQAARERVVNYYDQAPDAPVVDTTTTELVRLLNPNSYQKGAWVLHMLRYTVGDEAFWDGLEAYYRRYRDRNASTRDFQHVMEEVSGQDLGWFFDQWTRHAGHPQFEGSWNYHADAQELTVSLRQVQRGGLVFRVPLELGVYSEGEALPDVEVLDVSEREHTFTIPLEAAPARVELDPNTWVLMEADFE